MQPLGYDGDFLEKMHRELPEGEPIRFGALLRELRLEAGLSQEALAELAHMSAGGISVLERGTRRAPHRDTLALLANALNLSSSQRERFEASAKRAGTGRRRGDQVETVSARERHNLPFALTSFVGRDGEAASLRAHVEQNRLVTVTGVGGGGKTRLAIEVAHSMLGAFRDGVWLVELASLIDGDLVAQRVAETLGVASKTSTGDDWMKELIEKHQLVILDNCEHVLAESASLTKRLLEYCPQLRILTTSREPLRLNGERVVRLSPLSESDAVHLFVNRASDAAPEFLIEEREGESWQHVHTICRQLDGIPFAIELAAARVSTLSLGAIADNIGRRLKLLRHGSPATIPKHRTMRALIDWSYDLLSDEEQKVFEDLAIFGGGCTLETATRVCGGETAETLDTLEILSSLVEKSLVVVDMDVDEARYELLETTREYAWERLIMRGELEHVARRHALSYLIVAQRLEHKWSTAPDRAWFIEARRELQNWRIAINWALGERNDVLLGQRLIGALQAVWMVFALTEGLRWCHAAVELADEASPRDVIAKLKYAQALVSFLAGDLTTSLSAANYALSAYRALDDSFGVARAQIIIGSILVHSGKGIEGERILWEALEIAHRIDNALLVTYVHQAIGSSRGMVGDHHSARDHFTQALAIAKSIGAERAAIIASLNLAEAYFQAGEANAAIQIAGAAADASRGLGDEHATTDLLKNLARYLVAVDRYDDAKISLHESLHLSSHARGTTATARTLQHLATVAALRPQDGDAPSEEDRMKAAKIFGYTESRLSALGAKDDFAEQEERERLKTVLSGVLAPSLLAQLMELGASMSESQAIDEAMTI